MPDARNTTADARNTATRPLNVAVIGYGGIAQYVVDALANDDRITLAGIVCRPGRVETARDRLGHAVRFVETVDSLPHDLDVVVECAGHQALQANGIDVLRRGIDLIAVSSGALADPGFLNALEEAARHSGARVTIASGAIGALDAIGAACVGGTVDVSYTGRKPPRAWRGTPAEDTLDLDHITTPTPFFSGSAREAALRYPQNANVAATLALAGTGLDETAVTLVADPTIDANWHAIRVSGEFGEFEFNIRGTALAANPRSSALTAMSIIHQLRRRLLPIAV